MTEIRQGMPMPQPQTPSMPHLPADLELHPVDAPPAEPPIGEIELPQTSTTDIPAGGATTPGSRPARPIPSQVKLSGGTGQTSALGLAPAVYTGEPGSGPATAELVGDGGAVFSEIGQTAIAAGGATTVSRGRGLPPAGGGTVFV